MILNLVDDVNEYMKLYEYQRSRSFIDLDPSHSDSIFSNLFSSITTKPIEAKFQVQPLWDGDKDLFKCSRSHDQDGRSAHIWSNPLKTFSGTKRPMTLKICMQHRALEYYEVCSNNDPGLTLTYFTARSNLVPYSFVWKKQWMFRKLLKSMISSW